MRNGVIAVRIRRGDMVFHVHGDQAGREGVWLGEGQVQGIYDSPVSTTWKAGAFQVGSKQKGKKRPHRDLVLGFHVADTRNSYEFNESAFRQAFQYELDPWDVDHTPTVIEVETEISGVRTLEVLMFEQPEFAAAIDPLQQQYGNLIMKLRAGQPDWSEPDYTDTFTSTAVQATGTITVSNPTDQVAYQRFILTEANWVLPDPQWVGAPAARMPGGPNADRVIDGIDITDVSGGAIVDWDTGAELSFRDANNTNLQARLGSKFVVYPIPPQTPPTPLPISYTDAPTGGATAVVEIPRRWSRPWGMELQNTVSYLPPLGTIRFMRPGPWSYEIPADATHLDVVMLGGGGGGGASGLVLEDGGSAGAWSTTTLVRGGNLPTDTLVLEGMVGAGGKGGAKDIFDIHPGEDGLPSTCTGAGLTTLTAAGGAGSGHTGHPSGDDVAGPSTVFNGVIYTGGSTQSNLSSTGLAPGGGGSAGLMFNAGGDGARGQVWIRAYKVDAP